MKKIKVLMLMTATAALVFSCSKDGDNGGSQEITATNAKAVMEAEEMAAVTDEALTDVYLSQSGKGSLTQKDITCYTGVATDTGYLVTFTECEGAKGHILNGTVNLAYELSTDESVRFTATYVDFTVDGHAVSGTRSFVVTVDVTTETFTFTTQSDITITTTGGSVMEITGERVMSIVPGATLDATHFVISGTWMVKIDSDTYTVSSPEGVSGNPACTFFTSGVVVLAKNGLQVSINYGNGDCDNLATMTYPDGTEEEITLD
jgi:hypothetical protein